MKYVDDKSFTGPVEETFAGLLGEKGFNGIYAFSSDDEGADSIRYPIRSDFFTVILVERGTFHVRVNLKEYNLKKNCLAIAAPAALKEVVSVSQDCRYTGVIFTAEYLAAVGFHKHRVDALRFFSVNNMPLIPVTADEHLRLFRLLRQLYDAGNYKDDHPFLREIIQYNFLTLMFEIAGIVRNTGAQAAVKPRLDRQEELTIRFATLVAQNFKEKRKVNEYAEMMFITPKYLSEAVKDFSGKSAGQFIDEVIIQEAKYLLLNPALNIHQITEALGFPNQSQFGKFFKHHAGISPLKYRKSLFK